MNIGSLISVSVVEVVQEPLAILRTPVNFSLPTPLSVVRTSGAMKIESSE